MFSENLSLYQMSEGKGHLDVFFVFCIAVFWAANKMLLKIYSNGNVQCPVFVFVCIGNFCLFVALAISCSMKNKRIIEQKFYFHNKTHCYALHCICLSNIR